MLHRTRFENEIASLREYEEAVTTARAQTHYLPIDLNNRLKGKKVGAHVPAAAATAKVVDVIVYFHGVIGVCGSESKFIAQGIDYLWSNAPFDKMRSELDASGRAALLIVPRLDSRVGKTGTTSDHYGNLHEEKAFDKLIRKCCDGLVALKAIRADVKLGNIVLAAHSGGGSPMYAILGAKNDLRPKIRACWGFECLYPGMQTWFDWLNEDPLLRFRHFRQEGFYWRRAHALRDGTSKRFIDSTRLKDPTAHCRLIRDFWKTAIDHMPKSAGANAAF
ncbi:MAG TPA: hypothetical protein VFS58_08575 [Steroidobacteraceae bacterium]|nr:hypothetical protein [Steroidobacteraceae bacterium]